MKKFTSTLLLAAITIGASSAQATPGSNMTGFYLGIMGGVANSNGTYNAEAPNATGVDGDNVNLKSDLGKTDYLVGAFLGYGVMTNQAYLGAELYAGLDGAKARTTLEGSGNAEMSMRTVVRHQNFYGIAPRIGYAVTPNALAYIRVGIEGGQWKIESTPLKQDEGKTHTKNRISFAPGIGLETYITRNAFLRLEYSYLFGPKLSYDQKVTTTDEGVQTTVKHSVTPRQHAFKVAFGFKF